MFALVFSARMNHAAHSTSRHRFGVMPRLAASCVLGIIISAGLTGCGGDDNTGTTAPATNAYTGQYASTVALSNGRSGDTRITVNADGSATGTLTVNGTAASALRAVHTRAVLATYNLTGSVNVSTGQYSLNGTGGPTGFPSTISLSGTLPVSGTGGTLSLILGEQTFTGTLTAVSTTGGGTNPGNTTNTSVTFSNASGTNANTSGFSGVTVATVVGAAGFGITNITATNGSRILSVNFSGTVTAGQTLMAGDDATVQYVEGSGTSARTWFASSGSVVIDSISGSTVTYRVVNADLSPLTGSTSSTGTFRINASGTYVTQ